MVTTRGSNTATETIIPNTAENPANIATTAATANTAPASGANTQSSSVTLTMAQFQQLLAAASGNTGQNTQNANASGNTGQNTHWCLKTNGMSYHQSRHK